MTPTDLHRDPRLVLNNQSSRDNLVIQNKCPVAHQPWDELLQEMLEVDNDRLRVPLQVSVEDICSCLYSVSFECHKCQMMKQSGGGQFWSDDLEDVPTTTLCDKNVCFIAQYVARRMRFEASIVSNSPTRWKENASIHLTSMVSLSEIQSD